jgi:hypothetical protein
MPVGLHPNESGPWRGHPGAFGNQGELELAEPPTGRVLPFVHFRSGGVQAELIVEGEEFHGDQDNPAQPP